MQATFASQSTRRTSFLLRYEPLRGSGRCLAFPCDAGGAIDLDGLSDRVRNDYFAARVLVGRDFSLPVVVNGQQPVRARA